MQPDLLKQLDQRYQHIYLQPHFDDAALSCGGRLAKQAAAGQQVLILTVFGGAPPAGTPLNPLAQQFLEQMGAGPDTATAIRLRQAENGKAADILGAGTLQLNYPEVIYRDVPAGPGHLDLKVSYGMMISSSLQLYDKLSDDFQRIHELAPQAVFYAPLGVGYHLDHLLVFSAASRLLKRKAQVKFYEDFPYAAQPEALQIRQQELNIHIEPELVQCAESMPRKLAAILAYASQIPMLFGSEERAKEAIINYSLSLQPTSPNVQFERYWQPTQTSTS